MPTEVIMPKVDMDMTSGKIVAWHIEVGSKVQKGQPLFDIETDKAAMEVESPANGTLYHAMSVGGVVNIGAPVAWIYAEGEHVGDPPDQPNRNESGDHEAAQSETIDGNHFTGSKIAGDSQSDHNGYALPPQKTKARATPFARKLARDAGIDLSTLSGSALNGRVTRADVEASIPKSTVNDADANNLSFTHRNTGNKTPILLIHGLASDALGWAKLQAELPNDRPLIMVDLPAHGRSPKVVPNDFRSLVSAVRQGIDALELSSIHLVGHSLGGALALALADTKPRQVKSLTLISPAGFGPEINGDILSGLMRAKRIESLKPWLERLVYDQTLISAAFARLAMQAREDEQLRQAQMELASRMFPDATQFMNLLPALNRLHIPTRIIFGRNDEVIPWQHALRAPGMVSLNLLENTGHLPHMERSADVAKLIMSMLD